MNNAKTFFIPSQNTGMFRLISNSFILTAFFAAICLASFSSCKITDSWKSEQGTEISVANWNVQTFFDGNIDGFEYPDFKKKDNWNEGKYKTRLSRLCESLVKLNADIIVLEEIENKDILYDISNALSGTSWKTNCRWSYACFAKEENGAIGCAVLSKYPIKKVTAHSLEIRNVKSSQSAKNQTFISQPSMRPVTCVEIEVKQKTLCVIVNHWKSKSGGAEKSEIWRNWQESVAGRCAAQCNFPCILAGDFNRDAKEFVHKFENTENTFFRTFDGENAVQVALYSPWYNDDGSFSTEKGSYFYKDSWERIDHFFCNDKIKIESFEVCCEEPWLNENGTPFSYKIYNGKGYSDHLPIKCKIAF